MFAFSRTSDTTVELKYTTMRTIFLQTRIFRRCYSQTPNFDQFLTAAHLEKTIRQFQSAKTPEEWNGREKHAAVLLPLCHVRNEVCILYTLRKVGLRRHSGQVSFPGGMQDEQETPEETAIRETEEEIGISRERIQVYGCGSPVARSDVLITPLVGYIGHVVPSELTLSEQEVQHAFALPLWKFCDLNNCKYTRFRNGYTLPVFLIDKYRVWGLTAYITHTFLKCFIKDVYKFSFR